MEKADLEIKPRLIVRGERALGPGKADLLELIAATGSISAAARRMRMSYSRAWTLVDVMNRTFKAPLVEAAAGGAHGGGAVVTERGREALEQFRRMQADLAAVAKLHRRAFERMLK